jgi:hypothetical protein
MKASVTGLPQRLLDRRMPQHAVAAELKVLDLGLVPWLDPRRKTLGFEIRHGGVGLEYFDDLWLRDLPDAYAAPMGSYISAISRFRTLKPRGVSSLSRPS